MSIVPEGQKVKIASADTWKRYTRNIPEDIVEEEFNWAPPEDNFGQISYTKCWSKSQCENPNCLYK